MLATLALGLIGPALVAIAAAPGDFVEPVDSNQAAAIWHDDQLQTGRIQSTAAFPARTDADREGDTNVLGVSFTDREIARIRAAAAAAIAPPRPNSGEAAGPATASNGTAPSTAPMTAAQAPAAADPASSATTSAPPDAPTASMTAANEAAPPSAPLATPVATTPAPSASPAITASTAALNARATGLLEAMNQERVTRGLVPLAPAADLAVIAEMRAQDMSTNGYFAHVSPTGTSWLTLLSSTNTRVSGGGENLARVSGDAQRSVAVASSALMNSPTHRQNILNASFDEVGVAALTDSDGVTIFVTIFAVR